MLYDGTSTIVSVTQHRVAVTPLHGPTVMVPAGEEVASSASKVTGDNAEAPPLGRWGSGSEWPSDRRGRSQF